MTALFNVPANRLEAARDAGLVIRSHDPAILVDSVAKVGQESIVHMQLLSLDSDPRILDELPPGMPLELVVDSGVTQYGLLYRYADLLKVRPIRVRVPAQPGLAQIAKLATALEFAVILDVGQPDRVTVDEMTVFLDTYLHQATMAAPVEFFQSLLMAYFMGEPVTIWEIQDEDPGTWRYLTDEGSVVLSKRLEELPELSSVSSMADVRALVPTWNAQCLSCDFLTHCQGYFKLPDKTYQCREIITLLRLIEEAAQDLRKDYEAGLRTGGGNPS